MRPGVVGPGGPKRAELVAALASGLSWRDAAELVGVSRQTVGRVAQNDPSFRLEVAQERAARTERVLGALSAVALESVATLRELLSSPNDSVKASACRTALQSLLQFTSAVTLEERLTRVEAALAERNMAPVVPGLKAGQ